ncbi:MAG: MBL fold metallo-hydrolase [Gemmatimonadetes bacterium]|nr:MBL fold metallo-hydrolase [Gemmatimonadota bacterium]
MGPTYVALALILPLLFPIPPSHTEPGQPQTVSSGTTQLILLGTGTPNAEPDRAGSSLAVVVNGTPYLVDAGPGVVRRANEAFQNGVEGLAVEGLATVFLTHLHTDHTVGLPDLIYTPWVLEREAPLTIIGPAGTEAMARHLSLAYQNDVQVRLEGLEPANTTGHNVDARDVRPGTVFQDENVTVTAFTVPHGSWDRAFGYRFQTPDRTIVVSGDTGPSESVVDFCNGCDILVHEVYSHAKWELKPPDWKAYHAASHTSGVELGEIAARAEPGLLVLTHQLLWGATPEELVAEVGRAFKGRIAFGKDLDVF